MLGIVQNLGRILVYLIVLTFLPLSASAQTTGGGLPDPVIDRSFYEIEKSRTTCKTCKGAEGAFHAGVDNYDAARKTYEAGLETVREKTDSFLKAREEAAKRKAAHDASIKAIDDLLINRPDDAPYDRSAVQEAIWAEEDVYKDLEAANEVLGKARADLSAALRALEPLRNDTAAKMRAALRLQSAMHQCEFTCETKNMEPEEPLVSLPPAPVGGVPAADIPKPENFLGVVAKCAKCQALAEKVNGLRSKRRGFASDAASTYESLSRNTETLKRLEQEARKIKAQERALYAHLLKYFSPKAPPEDAHFLDQSYDRQDQDEAAQSLRDLATKRAENARDRAGLKEVIADQQAGLDAALKEYHLYTQLLEEAQRKLAECEKTCKPGEDDTSRTSIYDPAYPVPENIDPVLTICVECQHLVKAILALKMDRREVAHDIQFDVQMLKHARKVLKHAESRDAKLAADERLMSRLVLIGEEGGANVEFATSRLFEIEIERFEMTEMHERASENIERYETRIKENQLKHEQLTDRINDLIAELEICEFNYCKPGENDPSGISMGDGPYDTAYPQPEPYKYVETSCPDCENLAASLNRLLLSRYKLAHEIQSNVSRQKAHQAAIEEAKARLARLEAREAELVPVGSELNDPETKDELTRIDRARVAVQDEITSTEALLKADADALGKAIGRHTSIGSAIEAVRGLLAKCEATCVPAAEPPRMSYGQDDFVTTDCPPCEQLAGRVNDAVGSVIAAEKALLAAKAAYRALGKAQDARAEALAETEARERSLNDEWLTRADAARKAEIEAELVKVDSRRSALKEEQAGETAETKAGLKAIDDANAALDAAVQVMAELKVELKKCEEQCKPPTEETSTALTEDPSPFVRTSCPPCETLASQVNDAVGTLITAERDRDAAKSALDRLEMNAAARREIHAELKVREDALNDELLAGASDARQTEIKAEFDKIDAGRNAIEAAQEREGDEHLAARTKLKEAQARVDELTAVVARLKADLAECEKECAPPEESSGTAIPQTEETGGDPRFATTGCPECEQIVSLLNDAIGSAITVRGQLEAARAALAETRADMARLEAEQAASRDAFTAALVERGKLEEAGEDTAEQQEIIDAESDRAVELLTRYESLELKSLDQDEKVEELSEQLAEWNRQIEAQRAALLECERNCEDPSGEPSTALTEESGTEQVAQTPKMALGKSQPEGCRAGRSCAFEITATNEGSGAFAGPLFVTESRRVDASRNGKAFGDWHCSPTGKGRSLCMYPDDIVTGASVTLNTSIRLPGYVRKGSTNCIAVASAANSRMLVRMVQTGLAARGLNPGLADGLPGPRTNAAIAGLAEEIGQEIDPGDMNAVYQALFGTTPGTASASSAGTKICIPMTVKNPPRRTTPTPTPGTDAPEYPEAPAAEQPKRRPLFGINLGIGTGTGTGRGTSSSGSSIHTDSTFSGGD